MNIHLRAMEPEDLDFLYHIENDRSLWTVGTTNVPYSRHTLHDYMAQVTGDIYTDRQVRLIIENEQYEVVGITDLVNFDASNQRAELGIVIANQHRRQGYASAVIREMTDYALRVLHLHQLYAFVDVNNEASMELFRKGGWTPSATLSHWLFDGKQYNDAIVFQYFLQ